MVSSDTWNAAAEAAAAFPQLPPVPSQSGKGNPSISISSPADNDLHVNVDYSDAPENSIRSPFFVFGNKQNVPVAEDKNRDLPPLSRDPYAAYPSNDGAGRAQPRDSRDVIKRDEDEYFFGVPSDREDPVRATTWNEIRRRAADRSQGSK